MAGFPDGSDSKESACNAGDPALIPGVGRCPGEGNANPLQYCCLENSMDRGAWQALLDTTNGAHAHSHPYGTCSGYTHTHTHTHTPTHTLTAPAQG